MRKRHFNSIPHPAKLADILSRELQQINQKIYKENAVVVGALWVPPSVGQPQRCPRYM
jgi:hypothetical protein